MPLFFILSGLRHPKGQDTDMEKKMTSSEIFHSAHAQARETRANFDSYRAAFGVALRDIYARQRAQNGADNSPKKCTSYEVRLYADGGIRLGAPLVISKKGLAKVEKRARSMAKMASARSFCIVDASHVIRIFDLIS